MIIMVSEWIACLDKRPCDRSGEDLDIIYSRLKDIKVFERFHPLLLQQICYYGYYEDLEKGVTLFRQGDIGTNWYTVLSGSLEVRISETGRLSESVTLCTFGPGTSFGESVLTNRPRHCTIITRDCTELIRVEQKDFKILWETKVGDYEELNSVFDCTVIDSKRWTSGIDGFFRLHSTLTADHCLNDGYVGKHPVAWKEYCVKYR